MIRKIGVIYQDRISYGFLLGLRDRLRCNAELVPAPTSVGTSSLMRRKQAALAWRGFQKHGVDLIVRFTDADTTRWQDVQRHELEVFPDDSETLLVCGVAVENVEHWLALDPNYLSQELDISTSEITHTSQKTDRIKNAIAGAKKLNEKTSDVAARLVRDAPAAVFRKWLEDASFRRFYDDCRAKAIERDCDVPNEHNTVE